MADLNNLFNRLKTMGSVTQYGIDNPEAMQRISLKHPEYGTKWANVVRRTMNDLGNSGAPLSTEMPGGGTLRDLMITAPAAAEMNDSISSALRAGANAGNVAGAVDDIADTFRPRFNRLQQLYKTLT